MTARRWLTAAACLLVVGAGGTAVADSAGAADVPDGLVAGAPLTPLPEQQRSWVGLDAAPGYVAYNDSENDEYTTSNRTIHRLSDGAAVRDLTLPRGDSTFYPRLSGDAVVQVLPAANGWQPAGYVVDDLVTGAERSRISVPATDVIVAETASGLLVRRTEDANTSSEHVLEPDGSDVQVDAARPAWGIVGAADGTTVVQHVGNRLWTIDVATGDHHDIGAAGIYDQVRLTPHRVFWLQTGSTTTVNWADRDGGNPGSVTFTPSRYVNGYWPLGDDLLAQVYDGFGFFLAPIDLTTGQVGTPLIDHVVTAASTGDGGLALAVADTPAGHLETLRPGDTSPTVVGAFRPRYELARSILLDGDAVTVDVGGAYDTSVGPLLTASLGGDSWQSTPLPPPPPVMTSWSRTVGGTTWTWHTDTPVISATGTTGTVSTPCAAPDVRSGGTFFEVRGRWAMLNCASGVWVVDLSGRSDPWQVPVPDSLAGPALGNGFVAFVSYRSTSPGADTAVLTVTDLSDRHVSRDYGPIHGIYAFPRPSFSVDVAGGPRVAYLDGSRQPRVVTVDWLPDYGPDDVAAPMVTGTGGSAAVSSDSPIAASWAATDDTSGAIPGSGIESYDVRYRDGAAAEWTMTGTLQGLTTTTASVPAVEGRTTCWSVRARDQAGNVSDWSVDRCVLSDATAPKLTAATIGPRVVAAVTTTAVPFRYAASDATGVASYDLSFRLAPKGGALGPVLAPASWQHTTRTSGTLTVAAGGEGCFQVRARDRAGNLSPASAWMCVAVPLDDRAMTVGSGAIRLTQAGSLGGTVTALTRPRAQVSIAAQQGRQLVLSAMAGPGQGAVDVYASGVRVGRVALGASTWRRVVVPLPVRSFSGSVVLRSATTAPVRVDALAVLRG